MEAPVPSAEPLPFWDRVESVCKFLWIPATVFILLRLYETVVAPPDGDIGFFHSELNSREGWLGWGTEWYYPPLTGVLLAPLRFFAFPYAYLYFIFLITPIAIIGSILLLRWSRVRYWRTASVFVILSAGAMGQIFFLRFDSLTVLFALASYLFLLKGKEIGSGLWLLAAGFLKSWTFVIAGVIGVLLGRWKVGITVLLGAILVSIVAVFADAHPWGWLFFNVGERELHAESLAALPSLWMAFLGREGYSYGFEYYGLVITSPIEKVSLLAVIAVVSISLFFLWWKRRGVLLAKESGSDFWSLERLSFVAICTIGLLLISPVFSPTFVIWVAPILAVAVGLGQLRRESLVMLCVMFLSSLIYPHLYLTLNETGNLLPLLICLTVRDVLLILVYVSLAVRVWRKKPNSAVVNQ